MGRNRENGWCCGAGGGVKEANPDLALWTANERLKEAKATGAEALVISCPWCEKKLQECH
jgi:Fe-S oxidoreductase